MNNGILSSGLEDYIEKIYIANTNNVQLKAADLARCMNISRASVSEALARLVSKNLIKYNSNKNILLTDEGIEAAQKIYSKHSILTDFLNLILDIPIDEAEENACKIEHIISDNIAKKIHDFTNYCEVHQEILDDFRRGSSNHG